MIIKPFLLKEKDNKHRKYTPPPSSYTPTFFFLYTSSGASVFFTSLSMAVSSITEDTPPDAVSVWGGGG